MKMIARFSLYGFLKNMQFFEPFIILYFLQLGLNFFQIGILISFRSVCINILEIPSGAFADIYGRKNSMIVSLSSYIVSFIIFSLGEYFILLFFAMFFFSIGEAFRTGTHKAIIFDWLKHKNKINERTQVYGYTRSWSKIGSAISVIISASIVVLTHDYRLIFIFSTLPYIAGIWNILNYPSYLNSKQAEGYINIKKIYSHLFRNLKLALRSVSLRRLIIQGTCFEGVFRVSRDYLQPIIQAQALALSAILILPEKDGTAYIIGLVYFVIYMISASASRNSYRFLNMVKSEKKALSLLILFSLVTLIVSATGLYLKMYIIPILSFIFIYMIQNVWRPVLVSEYDNYSDKGNQATILSIESQSKSAGIFLLAPLSGFIADSVGIYAALSFMSLLHFVLWIYSIKK